MIFSPLFKHTLVGYVAQDPKWNSMGTLTLNYRAPIVSMDASIYVNGGGMHMVIHRSERGSEI